ncbi:Uncharacterized conserved protein [Plasmopara halstedii]|uniref:Uncharacterized conserved protein n=1 Tax=Plasmopara halstedii TaxID=4781 RepID=A0A0P1A5W1_PLAHL|nr:Uncharacterized conserved protein [Plasmopara halstedii]CEG35516.1 Uncharacterized conserved protein [Plasmopara halstedii]|eukprot:XP_024571885.1 Uncharacterized conserved protein [Plasmopara halstedii]
MESRSSGSHFARASLPGFVSTSVLTSSDGLFGDNVEEKRVTEAPPARPEDTVNYKPLYEQLLERKETKDIEWKEKNNPFAPPKGLDDEEFEYIQDLDRKKVDVERKRQAQHDEDLAKFLMARGAPKPASSVVLTAQQLQKYPSGQDSRTIGKNATAIRVAKAKRKVDAGTSRSAEEITKCLKKKQKVVKLLPCEKQTSSTAALGLGAYDSDSDEVDTN